MTPEDTKRRMAEGKIYLPNDPELMQYQLECLEKLYDYNNTRPLEQEKRTALLKEMFAEIGDNCYIEPPLHSNFGGKHVHFGKNVYANFNLTLVDDAHIYVGDAVMFAPNVILASATHPILPVFREYGLQYNRDIHIGNNVWIGAGSIVLPGITIGDNSVIGAGSIVTHDIPSNVVAYGNPCRVRREIGEHDEKYYNGNEEIDITVDEILEYRKKYMNIEEK